MLRAFLLRAKCSRPFSRLGQRFVSQEQSASPAAPSSTAQSKTFQRLVARTPRFLHPSLQALHNAPVTHLTAFLILHELTALLPLVGLAGAFHYYEWLPSYFSEGAWINAGVDKYSKYFKRKGWITEEERADIQERVDEEPAADNSDGAIQTWNKGHGSVRWIIELATAYAIVKVLFPLRILVSAWGAPWFARWTVGPVSSVLGRVFSGRAATVAPKNIVVPKK